MRAPIACTLALALCSLSFSVAAKPVAEPISWNHGGTDFDGVLVDTEWAIYEAWHRTFLAHHHPLPLEVYTRCIGSDFETWTVRAKGDLPFSAQ